MEFGKQFGHWTVVDSTDAHKNNGYQVFCKCDCGTMKMVQMKYLRNGKSTSCGCRGVYQGLKLGESVVVRRLRGSDVELMCVHGKYFVSRVVRGATRAAMCPCDFKGQAGDRFRIHGCSPESIRTVEYNTWRIMRQRCNNKRNPNYHNYGGRGIMVCERWSDFRNFLADMGPRPPGYSIERIDVNGNYDPSNCKWIPMSEQSKNRRKWARKKISKRHCDNHNKAGAS